MKKFTPLVLVFLMLILAACASQSPTTEAATPTTTTSTVNDNQEAETAVASTTEEPTDDTTAYPAPSDEASTNDTSAYPAPSDSAPGSPPPGAGTGGSSIEEGLATASGVYTLDGSMDTQSDQTYTAVNEDQSAVYVINGGSLNLTNATIETSGDTSSDENSSFYGLNAAVLAATGSTITMNGGTISTTGTGANGAFATGSGAVVNLIDVTIDATNDGGHGVMATQGGEMTLTNVDITTSGPHSGAVATDRGSGTITITGGNVTTSGADSPAIYSTGDITVDGGVYTATGAEAAVIEGSNNIVLTDVTLKSTYEDKWGVMIYQSFSGDAEGAEGDFTMTGGSLAYASTSGPLFYTTNSTGYFTLTGLDVSVDSGWLVDASANDRWGTSGENGGNIILTADEQTLAGDITADSISSVTAVLQNNSSLTGAINADNTAATANLTLDASSTWTVTADSYLTCLINPDGISGDTITNIIGNGYTVYYNADACPELGSQTYNLTGGGSLQPAG